MQENKTLLNNILFLFHEFSYDSMECWNLTAPSGRVAREVVCPGRRARKCYNHVVCVVIIPAHASKTISCLVAACNL